MVGSGSGADGGRDDMVCGAPTDRSDYRNQTLKPTFLGPGM